MIWDDGLKCGDEEIDSQHEDLFKKVGQFLRNCQEKKYGKETADFMKFLDEYVERHLHAEEKLQKATDYPEFFFHRLEHLLFKKKLRDLKNIFQRDGASLRFSMLAAFVVSDWLIQHVNGEDRSFSEFLRNRSRGDQSEL